MRFRPDLETNEYYLMDYDEMHNHQLSESHEIMPYPVKYKPRPKFSNPNFEQFKEIVANNPNTLKLLLNKLAQERGFSVK